MEESKLDVAFLDVYSWRKMKKIKKYNKKLGTSKREQGVTTPPAPQHPKRRREYFEREAWTRSAWYEKLWGRVVKWWEEDE